MPQEDDRIRTIAGYLLKNNARLILRAAPDVTDFVKAAVLTAFNDASVLISDTFLIIITWRSTPRRGLLPDKSQMQRKGLMDVVFRDGKCNQYLESILAIS